MSEQTHMRATRILDEAMRLMSEKNASYQDAWQEQGWRGCLARIMSKTTRLRNMLWRNNVSLLNGEKETPRETALDMINHLVFFIANLDDEREWGHEMPRQLSANSWQQSDEALHPAYLPPHPEQPPAMTGQHHIAPGTEMAPAVGQLDGAPPFVPVDKPAPVARRDRGKRKIEDVPQA